MSGDLISRSALLEELQKGTIITDDLYGMGIMAGKDHAMKKIKEAPAVEAVPVRTGRWIERLDGAGEFVHHMCSECKADAIFQYIIEDDLDEGMDGEWYSRGKITTGIEEHLTNCCPNCGVKMEQEAEE
jgi:hypothetical protein